MTTSLITVRSIATVHFLDALTAASGSLTPPFTSTPVNNLAFPPSIVGNRYLIRAIEYLAAQNVGLEFDFFSTAAGLTNVIATDTFISRYQFTSSNGVQNAGTGLYRYYVDGLAIPYLDANTDEMQTPSLHVAAQNVDTVAKSANATGAIRAAFWLEPANLVW